MILTFLAYSTTRPSGGVGTIFEFANAMRRRGHEVHLVHRPNYLASGGLVGSLEDIAWARFEAGIQHHFEDRPPQGFDPAALESLPRAELDEAIAERWKGGRARDGSTLPHADFVFMAGEKLASDHGLPLFFVQGELTGNAAQRERMRAPCPKVCVARWLVGVGKREGVPEEQLVYVPCGIRHDKYRLTTPVEDRTLHIAMLYGSHPKKGSRYGLAAIAEVARRRPDVRAVVFGIRRPEVDLPDCVTFLENPPQQVIVDEVYNRSRVFVQPSLSEGFGLTAVEAMACGCALVTTDNGGSEDYAFDGETALVTEPTDVAAMADAIEALLRDDEMRIRLASRGNEHARTFDWDLSAARLEAFLDEYAADADRYRRPSSPPSADDAP